MYKTAYPVVLYKYNNDQNKMVKSSEGDDKMKKLIKSISNMVMAAGLLTLVSCGPQAVQEAVDTGSCNFRENTQVQVANFMTNSNQFSCGSNQAFLTNNAGDDIGLNDGFFVGGTILPLSDGNGGIQNVSVKIGSIISGQEVLLLIARESNLNKVNVIRVNSDFTLNLDGSSDIVLKPKNEHGEELNVIPLLDVLTPDADGEGFELANLVPGGIDLDRLNVELNPNLIPEDIELNFIETSADLANL